MKGSTYIKVLVAFCVLLSLPVYGERGFADILVTGVPRGARIFVDDVDWTARLNWRDGLISFRISNLQPSQSYTFTLRVEVEDQNDILFWNVFIEARENETRTYQLANEGQGQKTHPNTPNPLPKPTGPKTGREGHLRFVVTLDTKLYINGVLTLQEGEVRDFVTPAMPYGKPYIAKVKFDFRNKAGRRIIRTKTFSIRPGETIIFDDIEQLSEEVSDGKEDSQ